MNIPNLLTLLRIVLIPVCIAAYLLPFVWAAWLSSLLFCVAAITDWLDGYLARKWQQHTPFGAFLDPVADKLIVAAVLVALVENHVSWLVTLPAIVIISREIIISALREWMAELGARNTIAVNWLGKIKTTLQMVAIIILLSQGQTLDTWLTVLGIVALQAAAWLTFWSMVVYLKAAWPELMRQE